MVLPRLPSTFEDFPLGLIRLTINNGIVVGIIDTQLSLIDDQIRKLIPAKSKRYVVFSLNQNNCIVNGNDFTLVNVGMKVVDYDTYDEAVNGNYTSYAKTDALITIPTKVISPIGLLDTTLVPVPPVVVTPIVVAPVIS